jgi:hypothetical protein
VITDVSRAIRALGPELARRAIEEMYRDPFWEDRFGARGRKFAAEDGAHHVVYLVQALEAKKPEIFTAYARWLQSVLVHRGMCTAHVLDNFARLARLLGASDIAGIGAALDAIELGRASLLYASGPARLLQDGADAIASAVARGNARTAAELRMLVWYLADAVETGEPDLFARHVEWARDYFERQKLPKLDALLAALDASLDVVPAEARGPARAVLAHARNAG